MNNFIIMGCHGTGKDTCVNYLQHQQPHLIPILPGHLIRIEIQQQTPLGKILQPLYEGKNLQQQHIAEELLNNYACELTCNKIIKDAITQKKPFILNGLPRSLASFDIMHKFFQNHKLINQIHVIHLDASDATCLKRIRTRLICPACGSTHNKLLKQKKECTCNTHLISRKTDTPELAQERVHFYRSATHGLIDIIKKSYRLSTINTEQSFTTLKKEYDKLLQSLY